MSEGELKGAIGKFTNEFTKLATLRYLDVVPLYTNIIVDAMRLTWRRREKKSKIL
jgi:hypothetical protein